MTSSILEIMDMWESISQKPRARSLFRARNQGLATAATEILTAEHPMTLRQLFYRCVSSGKLANMQSEYKRLGRVMTTLREYGNVPRTWLVDHLRQTIKPSSWSGLADFGSAVRDSYRKNFWAAQAVHLAIFVEKDAVAGTLQPVTEEYDVALHVCRGYASISFAGSIADEWAMIEKPIHAYYLGDFDPSGFDIERDLREKLSRYSGVDFEWRRLAITIEDFDDYDLIRLPVKQTDRRTQKFIEAHGEACAELDALPPVELRRRVEDAILSHLDADEWSRLKQIEAVERNSINSFCDKWEKPNLDSVGESESDG